MTDRPFYSHGVKNVFYIVSFDNDGTGIFLNQSHDGFSTSISDCAVFGEISNAREVAEKITEKDGKTCIVLETVHMTYSIETK